MTPVRLLERLAAAGAAVRHCNGKLDHDRHRVMVERGCAVYELLGKAIRACDCTGCEDAVVGRQVRCQTLRDGVQACDGVLTPVNQKRIEMEITAK